MRPSQPIKPLKPPGAGPRLGTCIYHTLTGRQARWASCGVTAHFWRVGKMSLSHLRRWKRRLKNHEQTLPSLCFVMVLQMARKGITFVSIRVRIRPGKITRF
jgi:hypothetical protein